MFKRLIVIFSLCSSVGPAMAQPAVYTTSNAHSHNDYEQSVPFWEAYRHGFGSIEADIFLLNKEPELLVAHTLEEISQNKRRLDSLYLLPLLQCIRQHGGYPFANVNQKLQLLIDVKTTAAPTLQKLVETLEKYPELTHSTSVQFAISGNRPSQDSFRLYPPYIVFDAELKKDYNNEALQKVVMMSTNLKDYTAWKGTEPLSAQDRAVLIAAIRKAHDLHKPVRFWGAPDNPEAWQTLMELGVDYINTDHIAALSDTLNRLHASKKTSATTIQRSALYSSCACNDSASDANKAAIEFHQQRCLTDASKRYDQALFFAPPKEASPEEQKIILKFAPRLMTVPSEPFKLKDAVAIMHPSAPWIAYHLFWEDDIDFPDDNDPCDHEIIWVRLNQARTEISDYFVYFHGRILKAYPQAVIDARQHQNRAMTFVQWGKHGSMPLGWKDIDILTDTKDIEYPFIRENSSSDTVNLYHYNEAIYKKLSTKGHQSLHSPFAKHWPQKFTGSFHDFINFSKPVDLSQALRSKGYMMVSCLNNAVINRYFLPYNFAVKTEWPEWICEDLGVRH
jgi:alkaline phosphatase